MRRVPFSAIDCIRVVLCLVLVIHKWFRCAMRDCNFSYSCSRPSVASVINALGGGAVEMFAFSWCYNYSWFVRGVFVLVSVIESDFLILGLVMPGSMCW